MRDFVVVGGGMGGVMAAAVLSKRGKDVLLFEKEPYLGGCASAFTRGGRRFNAGATTFVGYEPGLPVYEIFEEIGFRPELRELEYSHIVLQSNRRVKMRSDVRMFVKELNNLHYHPKNMRFWTLIKQICDEFYSVGGYFYSKKSSLSRLSSALSFAPALLKFFPYLLKNARLFISDFFGAELSYEYQRFLDAQTMIAVQADTSKINFLTAALALGYPFLKTYYVQGGMGTLFDGLKGFIKDVRTSQEVLAIDVVDGGYVVKTHKDEIAAKNVILNTPVFLSAKFFKQKSITNYFSATKGLDGGQSAFAVYMTIRSSKSFASHYQIIMQDMLENTVSSAVFVSMLDKEEAADKKGFVSLTASVHTMSCYWKDLDRLSYDKQKSRLQGEIVSIICNALEISEDEIVDLFAATPCTFERYIGRDSLGGVIMTPSNMLKLASNDTPFRGLYCVGDTVFAAQGWIGVSMGVRNLLCTM